MTPQELDHWAAEKVMGWNILVRDYPRPGHDWLYGVDGTEVMALYKWEPSDPTTGQIWLVIEKMRELGWDLQLNSEFNAPILHGKLWYADFSKIKTRQNHRPYEYESHDFMWARADNPCVAILKAARAAIEAPNSISSK